MKKFILPLLAVTLIGSTMPTPAHAWPWNKKPKDGAEATQPADNGSGEQSTEASQTTSSPVEAAPVEAPPPKVQVRSPLSDEVNGLKVEDPIESPVLPPDKSFVAVDDPKNPLGITTSAQKLNDCAQMIAQKKYREASTVLSPLKDWLIDATEAHINLHKTLKAIPSAQVQAELEKQLALQFALLRDKAFFQLGMLAIGEDDYSGAVKNLSRVIQSQPRSPMGAQAYEVLQKIGFTEKIQLREEKKDNNVSQN
jgi:hypothetical protein